MESGDNSTMTFQQLRALRRRDVSAERAELAADFAQNLLTSPADGSYRAIYMVSGVGGSGKTWLLEEFASAARGHSIPVGWTDQADQNVLAVMRRLAATLDRGPDFEAFTKLDARYQEMRDELSRDPTAPTDVAEWVGRAIGSTAVHLGPHVVPGLSLPVQAVGEEKIIDASGEAAAYLADKFGASTDLSLLGAPVSQLTQAFVKGLSAVCVNYKAAVLLFDAFERTSPIVEGWLHDVLGGVYGETPATLVIALAGQRSLSRPLWTDDEPYIRRIRLDVFSESEARAFLAGRGVADDLVVAEILRLSGRLPVLLAMLAAGSPQSAAELGDVSGTATEVFLKWVDDGPRRALAVASAFPRELNEDSLEICAKSVSGVADFEWLRSLPFVQERSTGWHFHEVVRAQLLRYQHKESPVRWDELHTALESHFGTLASEVEGDVGPGYQATEAWQRNRVERMYHRMCRASDPSNELVATVVPIIERRTGFAERLARAGMQAGNDADDFELDRWGGVLVAAAQVDSEKAVDAYGALLDSRSLRLSPTCAASLFHLRGADLLHMERFSDALKDFNAALAAHPRKAHLHNDRARTYLGLEDYDSADSALDDAISAADNEREVAAAWATKAQLSARASDFSTALEHVENALAISPKDAAVLLRRGRIYADRKEPEAAIADFKAAMDNDHELRHAALHSIGAAQFELGLHQAAEQSVIESLEIEPACGPCWRVLVDMRCVGPVSLTPERVASLSASTDQDFIRWRAYLFGRRRMYDCAIADLTGVHTSDEELIASDRFNLGLWNSYAGHYGEAAERFRELNDDERLATAYNLAVAVARDKGLEAATELIATAKTLAETEEDSVRKHYAIAGIQALQGEFASALRRLRRFNERQKRMASTWIVDDAAWLDGRRDQAVNETLKSLGFYRLAKEEEYATSTSE